MNLRQAYYIKTIAKEGGITAAAKALYISQPSLSQMLKQIEAEIGMPLFDRTVSPLKPTCAGERYLHAATIMLNTQEILENELQELREENSGRLRLGISMQRSAQLLPAILPDFFADFPHVNLELREAGSTHLEEMVLDGSVDLALATLEPSRSDLHYRLIQRETIGILAGQNSPLAKSIPSGTPVDHTAFQDMTFISMRTGHNIRVIQDSVFRSRGLSPHILLETDSMETARRITRTGSGCMLCSDSSCTPDDFFYPLKGFESLRHFYACYRQEQTLPRYAESFLTRTSELLRSLTTSHR